jgi:7,8-dihydro-6-hydroxymethylpterin-pyrophosphokinase
MTILDHLLCFCQKLLYYTLVEELESKVDWIKYEADLRRELVNKWSKRVIDQEAFHQEEIKKQRIQVEDYWLKKMSLLEELCEIRTSLTQSSQVKKSELASSFEL